MRQRIAASQASRMMWRMRSLCSVMQTPLRTRRSAPRSIARSTQFVPGNSAKHPGTFHVKLGAMESYHSGHLGYPLPAWIGDAGGESGGETNTDICSSSCDACCCSLEERRREGARRLGEEDCASQWRTMDRVPSAWVVIRAKSAFSSALPGNIPLERAYCW